MKPMFRSAAALALSMTATFSSPAWAQETPPAPATPPAANQQTQQKFVNLAQAAVLSTCTSNGHEFLIVIIPAIPESVAEQAKSTPAMAHHTQPEKFLAGLEKSLADVIIKYINTDLTASNTAMAEASAVLRTYTADFNSKNATFFRARVIRYSVTEHPEPQTCKAPAP